MTDPDSQNKKRWDEIAPHHSAAEYYNVDKFIADCNFSTLSAIEKREINDIAGKSLLHLQCHIGTDTLSLARMGAIVTGADYSDTSIEHAKSISEKSGVKGDFIVSNIYDLPNVLDKKFDIVYSNWGALQWLKDIPEWSNIVGHFLKPGGMFYMAEIHPFGLVYSRQERIPEWQYFPKKDNAPVSFTNTSNYASVGQSLTNTTMHQWPCTVADIVTGIVNNGMRIEFLHEHVEAVYKQTPEMVQQENGLFIEPNNEGRIPFSISMKAFKL